MEYLKYKKEPEPAFRDRSDLEGLDRISDLGNADCLGVGYTAFYVAFAPYWWVYRSCRYISSWVLSMAHCQLCGHKYGYSNFEIRTRRILCAGPADDGGSSRTNHHKSPNDANFSKKNGSSWIPPGIIGCAYAADHRLRKTNGARDYVPANSKYFPDGYLYPHESDTQHRKGGRKY